MRLRLPIAHLHIRAIALPPSPFGSRPFFSFVAASTSRAAENGSRPIVYPVPYRTYAGHKADVIDLAWSKANFLLSASIDKTVRLWYEWMSTHTHTIRPPR